MKAKSKSTGSSDELESLKAELERERQLRIKAEERLAEEKKLFLSLLDVMPAFVFIKDDKNNIVYANQKAAESRGLSRQELEGRSCFEVYPDDAAHYFEDDLKVIKSGKPMEGIIEQVLTESGEKRWVSTSKFPWINPRDKANWVLVAAHDITELVRQKDHSDSLMAAVAKALEASEERYYLAVRGSNDGVFDWNILTSEVYYSSRYKELLGFRDDEFPNVLESWVSHLHPDDKPSTLESVRLHLEDRVPYEAEFRMRHKNGEYSWFSARGQAIWDKDGKAYRMAGSQRDITDRKQAEQNVNEFFSTVSHELRTPLSAVKGSLRLIEGGLAGHISNEARELLDIALSSCERLIRLVNDILDLRKIEAGRIDLHISKVKSKELVEEVLQGLSPYAEYHGVNLSNKCTENFVLDADHDRLVQVLTNLVGNAVKFSGKGASVAVNAEKKSPSTVRFKVTDNGPGIPTEQHHLLFLKFKQLDSSDSRRQEGTGLGLAICKAIVGQHHGKIGVDSKIGKGSIFWFDLPIKH